MTATFTICTLPALPSQTARPHGRLALCPVPREAEDFAQVKALAPDLILSLTPLSENTALGVPDLPRQLAALTKQFRAFPITDYAIPPDHADWAAVSRAAQSVLAAHGTVLTHCRGGFGRSGMILLRLMIEGGEDPAAALARLRATRPGAVETAAQLHWATAGPTEADTDE
ncbi:protein-tyrosine phosphatase family protein [Pararhodobacter oceanensis]|uniref:phosphatase domain-containing protein n=1 Tax=Pararhodobacter oceanensis TaxID=2172121 RepID=UPI001981971E|nr:protein-tyrosine phosphatase family protein [Pararhodobacter oceanensis]